MKYRPLRTAIPGIALALFVTIAGQSATAKET